METVFLYSRICWGDPKKSLIVSGQRLLKLTSWCRCGSFVLCGSGLDLLAGGRSFLTECDDGINLVSCSVCANGGGHLLIRVFSSLRSSITSLTVTIISSRSSSGASYSGYDTGVTGIRIRETMRRTS